ncbi:hypothetical protein [Hymenobacter lucidus]|uniref:Uncharacterized protein n=1 Tax=Hymenobacter lucidus TaxID=2880930 RepID=A0ABS8APP9_9BACT|nr:hypothetical protein [Hymenobacter lucidus]MCB2406982.1 hypothetical protein [Hymenobacter lucidus]
MPITFTAGWDQQPANNNGATAPQILTILSTADNTGTGDAGLLEALTVVNAQSAEVAVVKGIHQDNNDNTPHITVDYLGGRWHINLVQTAAGGTTGYRVGVVTQFAHHP